LAELQDEGVLPPRLLARTNRYLHNLIEQDHRKVKQRVRPMLGFKCFAQAATTLSGIV
jgi:transposase-like protein